MDKKYTYKFLEYGKELDKELLYSYISDVVDNYSIGESVVLSYYKQDNNSSNTYKIISIEKMNRINISQSNTSDDIEELHFYNIIYCIKN